MQDGLRPSVPCLIVAARRGKAEPGGEVLGKSRGGPLPRTGALQGSPAHMVPWQRRCLGNLL